MLILDTSLKSFVHNAHFSRNKWEESGEGTFNSSSGSIGPIFLK